jgi:hypothetical protein
MNDNWVRIVFILAVVATAITALIVSVSLASNQQEKTGAIAVATACVAVLGAVVGFIRKSPPDK